MGWPAGVPRGKQSPEHSARLRESMLRKYAFGDPYMVAELVEYIIADLFGELPAPERESVVTRIGDPNFISDEPKFPRPVYGRDGGRRRMEATEEHYEAIRDALLNGIRNSGAVADSDPAPTPRQQRRNKNWNNL